MKIIVSATLQLLFPSLRKGFLFFFFSSFLSFRFLFQDRGFENLGGFVASNSFRLLFKKKEWIYVPLVTSLFV